MTSILKVDKVQNTGGTDVLDIKSDGVILMPNRPAFQASGNAGSWVTVSNGGYSTIEFDNVILNNGSHYSSANDRFDAPYDGIYSFTMTMYGRLAGGQGDNTNYWGATFHINGAATQYSSINAYQNAGDYDQTYTQTMIVNLTANDYVQVKARSWGTSNGEVFSNNCHFMGYLIG